MNISKLKAEIALQGLTIPKLAEKIGISKKAMYQKMKEETQFTLAEIQALCEILKIHGAEILDIFFNEKVA